MMCEHDKPERFKIAHDVIEKMTHDELVVSLIRSGLLRQYEMQINDLSDDLADAKAELAGQKPNYKKEFDCVYEKLKAEEQLSAHYKTELAAEREKRKQAEAQCAAMQTAINRYVLGNIELLDALKAALEEKP